MAPDPALVVRVSANITALQKDMAAAAASIKTIETTATTATTGAAAAFNTMKGALTSLAGAFGVAFSVGAVVNFGRALVETAGSLVDLRAKTGASLDQLQRWAVVGQQAGVATEQFADASFKLGIALAGGSKSVVAAVTALGLSYAQLRAQSPDEQFNAVVKALEAMESPQERNRVALELFGRSFASIAPAVAAGYTAISKAATVSSDAQILAIDRAADAWDRFVKNQKTSLTSWLGNAVLAQEQLGKLTDEQMRLYRAFTTAADFAGANKFLLDLANQVDIVLPPMKTLADETGHAADETKRLATEQREAEAAAKKVAAALREHEADVRKAEAAVKDVAAATDVYDTGLRFFAETVEKIVAPAIDTVEAKIRTLSGELISLADKAQRQSMGGTFELPPLTEADVQSSGGAQRLKNLEQLYTFFPGRRPGGNGPTGLNPNDSQGWRIMLLEQQEYLRLLAAHNAGIPGYAGGVQHAPGGWATVGERGPERMYVPQGATILPHDSRGGSGSSSSSSEPRLIQLIVDGRVLASVLDAAVIDRQHAIGGRF